MHRISWLAPGFALALMAVSAIAAEGDGNVATGKELADTKCAVCHNFDSTDKKIGPGLKGIKDGKLPSGKEATYKNIQDNLNQGGGGMPAFENLLTAEEKDHITAYLLTL
jgi:mono/diheme cytochrome c family protein